LIWTRIVILAGEVIFVSEWPKGEFVSFCVGYILLDKITSVSIFIGYILVKTKTLFVMVAF
jgi:hypothetical protein